MKSLADEAELEYEEAIVLLWDAGIEAIDAPHDFVPRNSVSRARRALGLHPSRPLQLAHNEVAVPQRGSQAGAGGSQAVAADHRPAQPFTWKTIGAPSDITYLDPHDVLAVHDALVRDFARSNDPISPPGIRDRNLLDSALFRPHTASGEVLKYPTISMAGAALFHSGAALLEGSPAAADGGQ